jgi:hypothetical protein
MSDALLVLALLGLTWALVAVALLSRRLGAVERRLAAERAETAARLETLEALARDRWLAESADLGGQVTAMIAALEETAARASDEVAAQRAALETTVQPARQRAATATARRRPARAEQTALPDAATRRARPAPERRRQIARLAAEGLTPPEIARRAGVSLVEATLILRLAAADDQPALQPPG